MKNLKRVLSLALTGVMLVGMMAIGASAANKDFTDKDEIVHTEAVDVMSTLGVLQGKDTGAFDPKATVTRGEMAKIITVMLNGGVDPTLGSGSAAMFSDTTNHWARKYIEYCASMEIIAGMGDGTFGPDLPVTGAAAAKMLLVALGYDSDVFTFTGPDWEINVNRIANTEAKLYEEIKNIDTSAGLSRDDTAQMAYNALEAKLMETSYDKVASSGEISYNYGLSNQTFLNKYFDAYTFIGQMTGNSNTDGLSAKGQIIVKGDLDTADRTAANWSAKTATFPSDLDISNIGEEVKVIFKDAKGGTNNRPDKNDTIYGVFNTGNTEVIKVTKNDVKDGTDSPAATNKINIAGDTYTIAAPNASTDVVVDYNYGITRTQAGATTAAAVKTIFEGLKVSQSGDTIKFVCNDDGEITNAYVVETVISHVTAVSGDKLTIQGVGTINISDNDVYEGVARYDVVTYTKFYDADKDDALFTVAKAESVEGEMTGFKEDKGAFVNVTIDGTTYKTIEKSLKSATVNTDNTRTSFNGDNDIGETFVVYLVNGYAGYVLQNSDSANKLALVTDLNSGKLGSTFEEPKVELLLEDGTKVTVLVDEDSTIYASNGTDTIGSGTAIDGTGNLAKGQIVRYSVLSSGAYRIVEVVTTAHNGYTYNANTVADSDGQHFNYEKDTKAFNGTVTDGNAVLFVKQGTAQDFSYKAYKIRSLNDVDPANGTAASYVLKDGKVLAAYVELEGRPSGASENRVYGIVTSYNGTRSVDGDSYKSYTVANDKNEYTVLLKTNSTKIAGTGKLVSFEVANDNVYADKEITVYDGSAFDNTKGKAAWVKEYSAADQTITYWESVGKYGNNDFRGTGTAVTKAIDDDVAIVYVNVDDEAGGDDVGVSEFDSATGYRNVLVVSDTNNKKVVAIFVESSREADILGAKVADITTDEHVCESDEQHKTEAKAATCTAKGNVEYYTCTVAGCGKHYQEAACTNEIADVETPINATNHKDASGNSTVGAWKAAEDADVTAAGDNPGFTAGQHVQLCSGCHKLVGTAHDAADNESGCTVCNP